MYKWSRCTSGFTRWELLHPVKALFLPAITAPISNFYLTKNKSDNLRRTDVINMKYIEETLQNLTGENVICIHG